MRTWYDVLGVAASAGTDEIRAAYRLHARSLHPDSRDPSLPAAEADAALRLLNEAWAVLGDARRRADYDATLEEDAEPADAEAWAFHRRPRFPWWLVALVVLFVIFVFTAYAGGPPPRTR